MSLKVFHFVFITLSCLLCMGMGLWAFREYGDTNVNNYIFTGIFSFMCSLGLIVYGNKFFKKAFRDKGHMVI